MESRDKQQSFSGPQKIAAVRQSRSFNSNRPQEDQRTPDDFRQGLLIQITLIQNHEHAAVRTHLSMGLNPGEALLAKYDQVLHENRRSLENSLYDYGESRGNNEE